MGITHGDSATPSSQKTREALAKMYKSTADCVIVYGMQTKFGGGSSTGFAHVYDSLDPQEKRDPIPTGPSRSLRKDRKESPSPTTTAEEQEEEGEGYQERLRWWWKEVNFRFFCSNYVFSYKLRSIYSFKFEYFHFADNILRVIL